MAQLSNTLHITERGFLLTSISFTHGILTIPLPENRTLLPTEQLDPGGVNILACVYGLLYDLFKLNTD